MSLAPALLGLLWPERHLDAVLEALTANAASLSHDEQLATTAASDFDPVEIPWHDLGRVLPTLATAVLTIAQPIGGHLALLAAGRGRRLTMLAPDGSRHRLSPSRLARVLCETATAEAATTIDPWLQAPPLATLSRSARHRARRALLAAHLASKPGLIARVAVPASAPWTRASRQSLLSSHRAFPSPVQSLLAPAAALAASILGAQALAWLAWLVLGTAVLAGRIETAFQWAWALLVLSIPCARAFELRAANALADRAALYLRRRLFAATLALPPQTLRADGTGQLLGRLLAAETYERELLASGPPACVAVAELTGAALALAYGAAPTLHLILLAAALAAAVFLAATYARANSATAASQRVPTGQLIETLTGHRTQRAQPRHPPASPSSSSPPPGAAAATDSSLARHHLRLRHLSRHERLLASFPRAWLLVGLGALATAFPASAPPPHVLALSFGGLLLAQGALGRLAAALRHLAVAATAHREIRPILSAFSPTTFTPAADPSPRAQGAAGSPFSRPPTPTPLQTFLLEARQLTCRLPGSSAPILDGAALTIHPGDRILLTGPSGAGKSTLAALLAAQRAPDSGLLLLAGYDLATLGTRAWRRRVVAVPQLHANHLFAGTLAWNLLLGRAWPPEPHDLAAATEICRDLGLGPLLARLPAGLDQRIGDAGWRLSDGEAARVCLARALLQNPDLLILDESLGALDPVLRLQALAVLKLRAGALLLIHHPEPG